MSDQAAEQADRDRQLTPGEREAERRFGRRHRAGLDKDEPSNFRSAEAERRFGGSQQSKEER